MSPRLPWGKRQGLARRRGIHPLVISAVSHQGVPEALRALRKVIDASAEVAEAPREAAGWQA